MAVLYRHIRLDKNEPFYIGIGKTEKRAYCVIYRNKIWKSIVNRTDYRVDILFDDLTWDEAKEKEKEFIKLYGRIDLGTGTLCNLTDGGDGTLGHIHTKEHKEKMSLRHKGRIVSDKTREKMSLASIGRKRNAPTQETIEKIRLSNKGKVHSDETKEKIRLKKTGKKLKPRPTEIKEKISLSQRGKKKKPLTQETKEKMSLSQKGRVHSDKTKEKMSLSQKGRVHSDKTKHQIASFHHKEPKPRYIENPKSVKKWRVYFVRFGKYINLGSFYTEQEAQDAIDKWKIENEKSLNTF